MKTTERPSRTPDRWMVAVALLFPTVITGLFYTGMGEGGSTREQIGFLSGKTIQFLLPVTWVFLLGRGRTQPAQLDARRPDRGHWLIGLWFGLAIAAAMVLLYALAFREFSWMIGAATQIQQKVSGMGVTSPATYILLGVFYSLVHSFLEEYYWRWFVFGQLRRWMATPLANAISSVGFMSHHVLVLAAFFGWHSPWTYLFSLSVAVGGAVWAWIYDRTGSLWGPWISHLCIDAAIFAIGFDLAAPLWRG